MLSVLTRYETPWNGVRIGNLKVLSAVQKFRCFMEPGVSLSCEKGQPLLPISNTRIHTARHLNSLTSSKKYNSIYACFF